MSREVLIPKHEPRFLTVAGDSVERVPCVSRNTPAIHRIGDPSQGVHHGIEVGGDSESVEFKIIGRVDHDGQVARRQRRLQTLRHLGPTNPSREHDDHGSVLAIEPVDIDTIDLEQKRHPFLGSEHLPRHLIRLVSVVVAPGQGRDVCLGYCRILNKFDDPLERDVTESVLDTQRGSGVANEVPVLLATAFGIHDDRIAAQLVPHHRLLRAAVSVYRGQYREALLFQKRPHIFPELHEDSLPGQSQLPQSTQRRQARTSVETWIYLRHAILRPPDPRNPMPSLSLAVDRAPLIVALDAGTSSVRALAFDSHGHAIGETEEQLPYRLETTPDGGATFPAESLFDLTVKAIDGVVARLGDAAAGVAAVGSTSFWHSLMGIDATGTPTTPVFYWADTRSAPEATKLRAQLDPDAIWQRTGCRLHSSYWPAKLRWLRRTDPDTFRRTTRWLSFAEYALGRLCQGEAGAATICMASGTGLLDVHAMIWDAEMLEVSGIGSDRLSPLVDLGPPGCLRADFANRWPVLADAHWFPALGDGACANVGSGATGPSRIALTVGTSAAVRMILPRPPDEDWTVPDGLWAYRLDRDRAVLGGALSNGGNLLRWIWNTTGTDRDDETTARGGRARPGCYRSDLSAISRRRAIARLA